MSLNAAQIQQFKIDGYLVLPKLLDATRIEPLRQRSIADLKQRIEPFELEANVHYPGAPSSTLEAGGDTIRRLLSVYQRGPLFAEVAKEPALVEAIQQILDCEQLILNPNHHNCVMTKQPDYSSETQWHRDTRYWQFDNKYLINAWVALGSEQVPNGAMKILPGSHRWEVQEDALDEAQFLIADHAFNRERLATARTVELEPGDTLLFSAHCFHAAGKNVTQESKYSLVFTYHGEATQPLPGSRSDATAEITIR